jgi:hypothetical protein
MSIREEETFIGNCYLFFPCSTMNTFNIEQYNNDNISDEEREYLVGFQEQFEFEVNSEIHEQIERKYVEELNFYYSDDKESATDRTEKGKMFITYHKETEQVIIVIAFFNTNMLVSHMLDRLSQNKIEINVDDRKINFKAYIKDTYKLKQLTSGKACLSVDNQDIEDNLFPHYFANETYDSEIMAAKIKEEKFGKKVFENIAQYDSSDIYCGKNTILRIDRREYNNKIISRIKSDIIFLFIIEILMFKESSIERTNQKMVKYISKNEDISLEILSEITAQFGKTMPFWNIEIFNYITAQTLANKIQTIFRTEGKFTNYLKNQKFLQHKINLKQAIGQEYETKILFFIGIIVFIFNVFTVLNEFVTKIHSLQISSGVLFFIILIIIKLKKGKKVDISN